VLPFTDTGVTSWRSTQSLNGLLGMLKTDPWIPVRCYPLVTVEDE